MPTVENAASPLDGLVHGDPVTIVDGTYAGQVGVFCGLTPQCVRVAIDGIEKTRALKRRFVVPNVAERPSGDEVLGLVVGEDDCFETYVSGPSCLSPTRVDAIASEDETEAETDEDDVCVSPEPLSDFDSLANAVGSSTPVHTHLDGRRVDCITVSDSARQNKNTFAFRLFGHRLLNVKVDKITATTESVPSTFQKEGATYELLLTSVEKAGSQQFSSYELHSTYVLTNGHGLPPLDLKNILEGVAGFGALPPEKAPARLELLGSKVRKSTNTRGTDGYLTFNLSATDDFELIDEFAHEGCGFIPKCFINRFLGNDAVGRRTLAMQVRIYSPRLGVFKGVLMEKRGITKIQLPTSMMKVGPSAISRDAWAVLTMTSNIFPMSTNVTIAKIRQGGNIPKKFMAESKKPSPMIKNIWLDSGLSQTVIDDYSKDCCKHPNNLMHASLVGLKDPTGAIPAGHVFVTGNDITDNADSVYVTRFPCTNTGDGFVLPVLREKPDAVSDEDWTWLEELHFGGLIFANPADGESPMPTQIAGGDLDGDLYFTCWDDVIVSALSERHWSLRSVENVVPEKKKFRQVEYYSGWLRAAQDKMADAVSITNIQKLVGKLHTLMKNSTGAEKEAFGAAYKESIDIGKHGGKVHLPGRLWSKIKPAALRSQLIDEDAES